MEKAHGSTEAVACDVVAPCCGDASGHQGHDIGAPLKASATLWYVPISHKAHKPRCQDASLLWLDSFSHIQPLRSHLPRSHFTLHPNPLSTPPHPSPTLATCCAGDSRADHVAHTFASRAARTPLLNFGYATKHRYLVRKAHLQSPSLRERS